MNTFGKILGAVGRVYLHAGAYFMTAVVMFFTLFRLIGGNNGTFNDETLGSLLVFSLLMGCADMIKAIGKLGKGASAAIHFAVSVVVFVFSFGIMYKIATGTGLLFSSIAFAAIYGIVFGIGAALKAMTGKKKEYKQVFGSTENKEKR